MKKKKLQVSKDLSVEVFPNDKYEFLIDTKSVSKGYGIAESSIHSIYHRHKNDFKKNKHFIKGISLRNTPLAFCKSDKIPENKIFWTKTGVIRLGFYVTSERGKLFRDWAEKVILKVLSNEIVLDEMPKPIRRKHNRLSQDRLISILSDVARIEDNKLRLKIVDKLTNY